MLPFVEERQVRQSICVGPYQDGRLGATTFEIVSRLPVSIEPKVPVEVTSSDTRLGDVMKKINAASIGVTASINANGDGLLLSDASGGGLAEEAAQRLERLNRLRSGGSASW